MVPVGSVGPWPVCTAAPPESTGAEPQGRREGGSVPRPRGATLTEPPSRRSRPLTPGHKSAPPHSDDAIGTGSVIFSRCDPGGRADRGVGGTVDREEFVEFVRRRGLAVVATCAEGVPEAALGAARPPMRRNSSSTPVPSLGTPGGLLRTASRRQRASAGPRHRAPTGAPHLGAVLRLPPRHVRDRRE